MSSTSRILVIAPHADDETIAMGGTIARRAAEGHEVYVAVVTGHGDEGPHPLWPRSTWDVVRGEARRACELLGVKELLFEEIPAVLVSQYPIWKLNRVTAALVERVQPEAALCPLPVRPPQGPPRDLPLSLGRVAAVVPDRPPHPRDLLLRGPIGDALEHPLRRGRFHAELLGRYREPPRRQAPRPGLLREPDPSRPRCALSGSHPVLGRVAWLPGGDGSGRGVYYRAALAVATGTGLRRPAPVGRPNTVRDWLMYPIRA